MGSRGLGLGKKAMLSMLGVGSGGWLSAVVENAVVARTPR